MISPTVSSVAMWAGTPKLGQGDEVGPGQFGGRGLAERVRHVLAQDAVAAVVDDQPGDVGVVLAGGGQLGDGVHGAAVAGDRERATARPIAAPSAAGKAKPRPPAPWAEWNAPSRGSHADQAQYPAIVMSQNVCVAGGTAARRSRMSVSSAAEVLVGEPALHRLSQLGRDRCACRRPLWRDDQLRRAPASASAASAWMPRRGMVGLEHPRFGIDLDEPAPRT